MIRLPYGISNFRRLREDGNYYVDRTEYIERLERYNAPYLFMLRPRRFGKTLFLSMLEYYYDVRYKDLFKELFGDLYIGKKPTKRANSYLILRFDFSGIDTSTPESTYRDFTLRVNTSIEEFIDRYQGLFPRDIFADFKTLDNPHTPITHLLKWHKKQNIQTRICLLIDEYDHFANEILSFHYGQFQNIVSKNGWVRKFYEAIKIGTGAGIIDRMYVTGISPLTLDSLTSGFNIASNISLLPYFNEMLGFTKSEVADMLKQIGVQEGAMEQVMSDMKLWYNGYRFTEEAKHLVYNPSMVLYFANHFNQFQSYPRTLLDINIASDYIKIGRLFDIGGRTKANEQILEALLKKEVITAPLTLQFNLANHFAPPDLVSLLYYSGVITIESMNEDIDALNFKMPNFVIKRLYYQYFYYLLMEKTALNKARISIDPKITALSRHNNIQPVVDYVETILGALSLDDKKRFDEKYIKILFASLFFQVGYYTILSEHEVSLANNKRGKVDLLLMGRAPYKPRNQFVFELKYLPKAGEKRITTVMSDAVEQLQGYLASPEMNSLRALRAYVVVFVGNKAHVQEVTG